MSNVLDMPYYLDTFQHRLSERLRLRPKAPKRASQRRGLQARTELARARAQNAQGQEGASRARVFNTGSTFSLL